MSFLSPNIFLCIPFSKALSLSSSLWGTKIHTHTKQQV
jgi:hypothetical protein